LAGRKAVVHRRRRSERRKDRSSLESFPQIVASPSM
jgi:hypothetical protein